MRWLRPMMGIYFNAYSEGISSSWDNDIENGEANASLKLTVASRAVFSRLHADLEIENSISMPEAQTI